MSYFYSRIQGHRGEATRCGTQSSGILAEATGWDIGGKVTCKYNSTLGTDVVSFYRTTGSNGHSSSLVASFAYIEGKLTIVNTTYPELFV